MSESEGDNTRNTACSLHILGKILTYMVIRACERYRTAVAGLEREKGKIDAEGLMSVMSSIQGSTQWSIVYDLEDLSLILVLPGAGDSTRHEFSLAEFMARMDGQ